MTLTLNIQGREWSNDNKTTQILLLLTTTEWGSYFAFLDHTLSHLNTRFPPELEGVLLATFLPPGNINNVSNKVVADIKAEYAAHLLYPSSFESEVMI